MANLASPLSVPANRVASQRRRWLAGFTLLLVTIVLRWPLFGDPNYHIDEGFYLLVGERMHDGMLPYVDIWDRKPFGLFLLYWLITFFGDVHAYQVAAGLCVWLTAWVIATIVSRRYSLPAALAAGTLYIAALGVLAGGGGQSPVFYNLSMALAGLLTLDVVTRRHEPRRKGIIAMLLCGVAMVIKPTSLFEGVFFGLLLSYQMYQTGGWAGLCKTVPALVLAAILPTALCFAHFAALGHGALYFDATVTSIFATAPAAKADEAERINWLIWVLAPFAAVTLAGAILSLKDTLRTPQALFVAGWLVAALVGFMAVPNYFDHYALPLATVMAIASAAIIPVRVIGPAAIAIATLWMLVVAGYPQVERTKRSIAAVDRAVSIIRPHLTEGCLFAYDVPAVLYRASDSCLPTSRIFSEHLSNAREAKAIGLDASEEVMRILAKRPPVIAIAAKPTLDTPNRTTLAMMRKALHSDYMLLDTVKLYDVTGPKPVEIWKRSY
jgi:MFS family permease